MKISKQNIKKFMGRSKMVHKEKFIAVKTPIRKAKRTQI